MDKNKSIDGLSTRRAKTSASSKKPTKTNSVAAIPVKSKSTTKTAKTVKATKTTKPTKSAKPTKTTKPTTKPTRKSASRAPKTVKALTHISPKLNSKPTSSELTPEPDSTPTLESTAQEFTQDHSISSAEDFLSPTQAFNFDEQTGELQASDTPIDHHAANSTNDTDATDEPTTENPTKHRKVKKPVSKKRKIITSIILAIVLLLIAGITWLVLWGNDIIAKITGGQGNILDLVTFMEPTYERLKTDDNGRTNILAIGTSGYNMEGDEGNGIHDGAQLTDSIMVISLNQDTGDVAMLSLPRDLKASPTCTATGKINEVYWCNNMEGDNEQAGAEALMEEVGSILGIDFQYYAHLNWGSLVQIVDTLGGITVTLDEDIEDYYYTGIVFEAGKPYTISGIEAVALARARHGTASGDFSRGASQQKILIGIKNKVFEKQLSLTDLIGLANTLGDNLRTNFNVEELKSFAHLASEFDFDAMRQLSLIEPEMLVTTGTINGISYVLPAGGVGYYTRIQDYVDKMLSNNPSVYEDASILVLNGTETPGLAATEQKSLEDEGYANIIIDDAPEGEYTDQYSLYVLDDTTPATKKLLESKYSTTSKSYDELPPAVSRDYNFVLILGGSSDESE